MNLELQKLIEKYEADRAYYLTDRYNETQVRSDFLDPLFELLGWDINNKAGRPTNEREVILEEPLRVGASENTKKPDYTFRLFAERKFFLEAKKPSVHIDEADAPARQVRRYGYTANLKVSILSNFEYLMIFDTSVRVEETDVNSKALIKKYHYTEYEDNFEELQRLLGKDSVYSGRFDEEWNYIESKQQKSSIDQDFLKQINEWRLLLGNEILKSMPGTEIDELGDIVQSYINKILFLRVCEDRNIETYQSLLAIANENQFSELVDKFREADTKYNSGLFRQKLSSDVICNISSSFWAIIKQLYYPESPYSFAVLSSDVLGRIYEIFLTQRLSLNNDGNLIIVDKPENQDRDIVTTPNYIISEILRQTIKGGIAGKSLMELTELRCADIACGSGAFLLELYQTLCDTLVDYYLAHDRSQLIQTNINTYKLRFSLKRELLTKCIFGVDKDFNAVEACKFGLLLKLLEGEDNDTLSLFHPVLPNLDNNIFYGNSLLSPDDVPDTDNEEINPFDFEDRTFDYIVGNPPYMKTEDIKTITPSEHKLYPQKYPSSAYMQYDKYFLFIERAYSLLKANGRLGYIVPNKFMKVGAAKGIRNLIASNNALRSITSFGAHQVFAAKNKSTYTCILILQKDRCEQFDYTEVKNLKKWIVRDNSSFETNTWDKNSITSKTWVLYTDNNKPIYEKITRTSQPLVDILGEDYIFNGIQTSKNSVFVFKPTREDANYFYFKACNGQEYQIEKKITKTYYETDRTGDKFETYKVFEPNAHVIFPYRKNKRTGKVNLIPLKEIQRKYPYLYTYLLDFKTTLENRSISPKPKTRNEWHRYGRSQNLTACEVKQKLIVGVMSQGDKYAIDDKGTIVSSGGTAGYCVVSIPPSLNYSIYYIQALLGSLQGEWLASLYGEIFRGGFISRGTKVLMQIPIHTIDFSNNIEKHVHDEIVERQKKLISLGNKLSKLQENSRRYIPLKRQFDTLKSEQQQAINTLYCMSEQEAAQIPIIKEQYAAD